MNKNIRKPPKLEDLVNEKGDLVYRPLYRSEIVVIKKVEIEKFLNGRTLDNTTIWEVIAAWEEERKSPNYLTRLVLFPGDIKSIEGSSVSVTSE